MSVIDLMTSMYRNMGARGVRPAGWTMDQTGLEQLRSEAAAERTDVLSITYPITFLGVPIEIVPKQVAPQADYVGHERRIVPCQRLDRPQGEQWDVFNLDTTEALGHIYTTNDEATAAAAALDR